MDIIYTDKNRNDIGYLPPAEIDIAFGRDENDFKIDLPIQDNVLEDDFYFYENNSEIGGVVDKVEVDTKRQIVSYLGRTWHGILASKVIKPDIGEDYLIVDGNANDVIADLITRADLDSLFEVDGLSEIEIDNYKFPRYVDLYHGIIQMLLDYNSKLSLNYHDKKVHISAVPLYDYSRDEEWSSSQVDFQIKQTTNHVNHLICLGGGELAQRHVIELFTDENGGIQPYTLTDNPIKDSQYILDNRNQRFFGVADVSEVFDYPSAQSTENYERITEQPEKWEDVCVEYYKQTENGYEQLTKDNDERYDLLTQEPDDWVDDYSSYYYKKNDKYYTVGDEYLEPVTAYVVLPIQPKNWAKEYNKYYYRWTDGVKVEYRSIPSDSYSTYGKQTEQPSDWKNNFGNYYVRVDRKKYTYEIKQKKDNVWKKTIKVYYKQIPNEDTKTKKVKLIKQETEKNVYVTINEMVRNGKKESDFKNWKKSKYRPFYTEEKHEKAPSFSKYEVRIKVVDSVSVKPFSPGTFYEKVSFDKPPAFVSGKFFAKVVDNYSDLAERGIERLKDLWATDSVRTTLNDSDTIYDIGDRIGTVEQTTGLQVIEVVTKKIVRINKKGIVSIEYEVGTE